MAFGDRLKFFRTKFGLTQKMLGRQMGFPERSADIRIAQYENGSRYPKDEVIRQFASLFKVSPDALSVPDVECTSHIMHTLFALEDLYGLRVVEVEGEPFLYVDREGAVLAPMLHNELLIWSTRVEKLKNGDISREEYDRWRYSFPQPRSDEDYVIMEKASIIAEAKRKAKQEK